MLSSYCLFFGFQRWTKGVERDDVLDGARGETRKEGNVIALVRSVTRMLSIRWECEESSYARKLLNKSIYGRVFVHLPYLTPVPELRLCFLAELNGSAGTYTRTYQLRFSTHHLDHLPLMVSLFPDTLGRHTRKSICINFFGFMVRFGMVITFVLTSLHGMLDSLAVERGMVAYVLLALHLECCTLLIS